MPPEFLRDTLHFPSSSRLPLDPYLPSLTEEHASTENQSQRSQANELSRPFTTLTFATSLDSALSLAPGVRTALSGPQSKAMTHYLRFRHEAILIGVGTANADDPGLNCRIEGAGGYEEIIASETDTINNNDSTQPTKDPVIAELTTQAKTDSDLKDLMKAVGMSIASAQQMDMFQARIDQVKKEYEMKVRQRQEKLRQPRPIVIDPKARWALHERSKIIDLVKHGKGKAPFVIISKKTTPLQSVKDILERYGGKFIALDTVDDSGDEDGHQRFDWTTILNVLATEEKIKSLMIEGGGSIINSLLSEQQYSALIDSVIVTIAPTWLGQGGVVVSPNRRLDENGVAIPASRLTDVKWCPFGEDVVLCGRILAA